jgi:hypothetical protein
MYPRTKESTTIDIDLLKRDRGRLGGGGCFEGSSLAGSEGEESRPDSQVKTPRSVKQRLGNVHR